MLILAEVAAHTDDRNLLQQKANDARNAHFGSPGQLRASAYVLTRAAWYRGDVHEAARWLSDINLLGTPLFPHALVRLILGARVASAAADAGLRARVLQATEVLERERPVVPLLAAVAGYARGILERDAHALVAAAGLLESSERPLLYAGAAEDAGAELARTGRTEPAIEQLTAAFDAYTQHEAIADARRVGRELRRLGVERRIVAQPRAKTGWDSLTDAELKVINLTAEGATNRTVAQQLHLSPHTVKTHLHNAFAKLGITSRAQLTQLLRRSDGQSR
jgi:DNA-binding CsgD family transcriptional regulator